MTPSPFGEQPAPFGGPLNIEEWRISPQKQKCTAFKIKITEVYDPSLGVGPGAGFTLSGLNLVVGIKKGYRPMRASNTIG